MSTAYRYEERRYAPMYDESSMSVEVQVELREFPIVKRTQKGFWINNYGQRRFIRSQARKRFACESKTEAIHSFLARKKRQKCIYLARLSDCQEAITKGIFIKNQILSKS